jgi:hypothetical protein
VLTPRAWSGLQLVSSGPTCELTELRVQGRMNLVVWLLARRRRLGVLPLGVTGNTPDSSGTGVRPLDTTPETVCVNALEVGEPFTGNAEPSPERGRCRDWVGAT